MLACFYQKATFSMRTDWTDMKTDKETAIQAYIFFKQFSSSQNKYGNSIHLFNMLLNDYI